MDLSKLEQHARCFALVGQFLHAWTKMEAALVDAIGSTLTSNPKLQVLITTERGFRDHIYTLNTLVSLSRSFSNDEIISHMHKCNSFASKYYGKRNIIAHDPFEMREQGVEFKKIDVKKGELRTGTLLWTADELQADIASIDEFRAFVDQTRIRLALQPLPKQVYDDIGWNWWQQTTPRRNLTLFVSSHNSDQPNSEQPE